MKKKSPPYAIIGALVFAAIAIVAFHSYTVSQEAKTKEAADAARKQATDDMQKQLADANNKRITVSEASTDVRNVLYATQPVEPGVHISPAFYTKKLTPKDILPDAYTDATDLVQWYAIRKIEKGDPLTPRNVGKSLPYMSQRISPGMRAVSLPVFMGGEVNNTGGFVVDGDRVDLLLSISTVDNYYIKTQMFMQNLTVLYIPGPTIKTDKTDGITPVGNTVSVTFEVTPEQAQALVGLQRIKNINFSMILRARKDTAEIKIKSFNAVDYAGNFNKVQHMTDKSYDRVKELAAEIEAKEKEAAQGTTNETTTPTAPTP